MKSKNYHYLKVRKRTICFFLAGCIFALIGLGSYYLLTVRKGNQGKEIISPVIEVTPTPTSTPTEEARKPLANTAYASYYCEGFEGNTTASGSIYSCDGLTFAHKTMKFGTKVDFLRDEGGGRGRIVTAICTDRGPFIEGREFDFSRAVFERLGSLSEGVIEVRWEVVK